MSAVATEVKPRIHVRMFKPQFAPKVRSGVKRCTIRPDPVRKIHIGDSIDCREWSGKPYRSKQSPLICGRVIDVAPIVIISEKHIRVQRVALNAFQREELAVMDGFDSAAAMFEFFSTEHELPFIGVLIHWDPTFSQVVEVVAQ